MLGKLTTLTLIIIAFSIAIRSASAEIADGVMSSKIEAQVRAKLAGVPTYIVYSTSDLLTASVGIDSTECSLRGVAVSATHCAEMARKEILLRRPVSDLLRAVEDGNLGDGKSEQALELLENIGGPEVESGLGRLAEHFDGSLGNYLALMHFASKCQPHSLRVLNDHWWKFEIPSFLWAEAIEQFGKCHYRSATTNLIDALDAGSGNAVDAAIDSLSLMYPAGPHVGGGDAAARSWRAWITARGTQ